MISQGVIYSALIGVVLAGIIPLIAGIVLLATKKIKGSSFWAGVLAFIISTIVSALASLPVILSTTSTDTITTETPLWQTIAASIISAVVLGFAMLILIKNCMKTRTFKAAVSAGLGFGIPQIITIGFGLVGMYITFAQINSGAFDQMYAMYVDTGLYTKEMVAEMKSVYTDMTVTDMIAQIVASYGNVLIMASAAIFIMIAVTQKKAMLGTLAVIGGISVTSIISSVIPNLLVASIIALAIGAAAFYFAYATREKIVAPEQPTPANDAFMQSIANVKEDN